MIEEKDIYKCIKENNAPYIRIFDMNKNLLHIYEEDKDVDSAILHIQTILPMFKAYGKVIVNCANEKMKAGNYNKSFFMTCLLDKGPLVAGAIAGPQFNPWQMPNGFVSNDVMMAKIETLEKVTALNREIDELKRQIQKGSKEDPMRQIEKIAPWAMYAMGKTPDEIAKVTTAMRIGNANLHGTMPSMPTNSLTFKDVEAKPTEEKEKQFQALADSISKKVSIEQMILLYDVIDKDPSLVETALQALPLLKKD